MLDVKVTLWMESTTWTKFRMWLPQISSRGWSMKTQRKDLELRNAWIIPSFGQMRSKIHYTTLHIVSCKVWMFLQGMDKAEWRDRWGSQSCHDKITDILFVSFSQESRLLEEDWKSKGRWELSQSWQGPRQEVGPVHWAVFGTGSIEVKVMYYSNIITFPRYNIYFEKCNVM